MVIGVKDGRAVSVRGNPDHPVNRGMLCPKGLSEHHTLDADNRAKYPLLRSGGRCERVSWDEALSTMVDTVPRDAGASRRRRGGRDQHRPTRHRGVLHARQAGAARLRHAATTTATPRSAWPPRSPATSESFGSDGPPGAYDDLETADVVAADRRQHRRQPSDPLPPPREQSRLRPLIVVDPRVTKTAMMADLHLPIRPRSDLALLNGIDPPDHRARPGRSRLHRPRTPPASTALRASVAEYTPEHVAEITGLVAGADLPHRHGSTAAPAPPSSAGRWA